MRKIFLLMTLIGLSVSCTTTTSQHKRELSERAMAIFCLQPWQASADLSVATARLEEYERAIQSFQPRIDRSVVASHQRASLVFRDVIHIAAQRSSITVDGQASEDVFLVDDEILGILQRYSSLTHPPSILKFNNRSYVTGNTLGWLWLSTLKDLVPVADKRALARCV